MTRRSSVFFLGWVITGLICAQAHLCPGCERERDEWVQECAIGDLLLHIPFDPFHVGIVLSVVGDQREWWVFSGEVGRPTELKVFDELFVVVVV